VTTAGPALLAGRYQLGALLGYGGMAEVFRGQDVRLGREVAVKVLHADLARDPSFLARFRREAQSAAGLSHPAIVSVYDTGEGVLDDVPGSPRLPFIVMEYVEGRTLREVLGAEGRLMPRRATEIVGEICEALEYSHQAGIVHRDIKPANVMITRTGMVKVMDFGIARAVSASSSLETQTAAVTGTAQYLSPEQARGEHVDARSDVYSTGVVLYELLTGRPPFVGDSAVAVAYQHVREDPTPPSQLDPDITPDLDAVVLKAMAKNPANRYDSAAGFGADLARIAAGRRVAATPVLRHVVPAGSEDLTAVIPAVGARATAGLPTTVLAAAPGRDPRRPSRGLAYALLAAAVIGVFIVAALAARSLLDSGSTATGRMPQVVGQRLPDAQRILADAGVGLGQVSREFQKDTKHPRDEVLRQDIAAGFTVRKGETTVNLVVSDGQQMVQVPPVVGQDVNDAKKNITDAGLAVGTITMVIGDLRTPAGTVQGVGPRQGTTVPVGRSISLTVVSDQATLPDVRRFAVGDGLARLTQAGFTPGNRTDVPTTEQREGTIVTTSPGPGPATRGASVDYSVAVKPPPPSPTPSPTPSASAPPAPTPKPSSAPPSTTAAPLPSSPPPVPPTSPAPTP